MNPNALFGPPVPCRSALWNPDLTARETRLEPPLPGPPSGPYLPYLP